MDFSCYPLKLTKRKNKLIIFNDERLPSTIAEEGDRVEMLAHALAAGAAGLTESQWQIAEGLGWKDELEFSPFRELVQYLDEVFKRITTKEPVSVQIPEMSTAAEVGKPFYAMINHCTLAVSREFVKGKAVYKSNYSLLQASEDYQETLTSFIQYLTRGREAAVFCKVTEIPKDFDPSKSIMTCCSAECDVFLPTGLCKGLSRRNGAHITDVEVFSSIVMDYTKVMQKIHRRGYELRTHFYLTRGCDIQLILSDPEAAKTIWAEGGYRDYRCVTISDEGEVALQLRQEVTS